MESKPTGPGAVVQLYHAELITSVTVGSRTIGPPEFSPLDPIVNKSCNIEHFRNNMHQIVANMMLSQYLQLLLHLL